MKVIADFEHGVNHKDLNRHILLETIHLVHHNMFRKTNVSYPPDTHKYVWASEDKFWMIPFKAIHGDCYNIVIIDFPQVFPYWARSKTWTILIYDKGSFT